MLLFLFDLFSFDYNDDRYPPNRFPNLEQAPKENDL